MKSHSNLRWVTFSQATQLFIQALGILLLGRMLTSTDFGLIAVVMIVVNFGRLFQDLGTSTAIIQIKNLTKEILDAAHTINVASGVVLWGVISLSAGLIASFFNSNELEKLIILTSPVFILNSLASSFSALLARDSKFKKLAAIEVFSSSFALALAIFHANVGGGVYALVTLTISNAIVLSIVLYIFSKQRPVISLGRSGISYLKTYAVNLTTFNFINYGARNLDVFIIGKILGPSELGLYSIGYRIIMLPYQAITAVISKAMLPILRQYQNDKEILARYQIAIFEIITLIVAPAMLLLWVLRQPLVSIIFGDKWSTLAELIQWYAPVGYFFALSGATPLMFITLGRTDILVRTGITQLVLTTTFIIVGIPWGIQGAVIALLVATAIHFLIVFRLVCHELGLKWISTLIYILRKPLMICTVTALLLDGMGEILLKTNSGILTDILAKSCLGFLIYASMVIALYRARLAGLLLLKNNKIR